MHSVLVAEKKMKIKPNQNWFVKALATYKLLIYFNYQIMTIIAFFYFKCATSLINS